MLLAALLLGGVAGFFLRPWLQSPSPVPRPVVPRGDLAADERSTIALFEQASPSVVFISTTQQVIDPWSLRVFQTRRGTGSGFIWDRAGHVVTNYHVIKGASSAIVRLHDGRAYRAVLVGSSPDDDLAVLRIKVPFDPPPPIPLGDSASLKVGQKVFAIGNPFGLDHTLTTGIVSALERTLRAEGQTIRHLIQTDAAINPGNSGGPLLDSAGRLIGVNTAIYSPSGAYAGIGFAIPSDRVNEVVPQLIAHGRVIRPRLGVGSDARLSAAVVARLGLEGVLVLRVEPGSPAARAGLRPARLRWDGGIVPGDIILALNGQPVRSMAELRAVMRDMHVGDTVRLRIWREGEQRELEIPLDAPHEAGMH
ncbi:MAG: PDZ domain-containing protein [Zetaproteobacteria bacterium]|nr:MAG: PDZ domain-containing protein [Zetaproteobacteria bacterium]